MATKKNGKPQAVKKTQPPKGRPAADVLREMTPEQKALMFELMKTARNLPLPVRTAPPRVIEVPVYIPVYVPVVQPVYPRPFYYPGPFEVTCTSYLAEG